MKNKTAKKGIRKSQSSEKTEASSPELGSVTKRLHIIHPKTGIEVMMPWGLTTSKIAEVLTTIASSDQKTLDAAGIIQGVSAKIDTENGFIVSYVNKKPSYSLQRIEDLNNPIYCLVALFKGARSVYELLRPAIPFESEMKDGKMVTRFFVPMSEEAKRQMIAEIEREFVEYKKSEA